MIPSFGFRKIERLACIAMGFAGLVALGEAWGHSRPYFLMLQSVAVIAGGIGARINSFTLAAIGVISSLMLWTPVGRICFLPGLLMLFLIVARIRAFEEFVPRWRGPGPPPSG
jgi:hypothetical protein